MSRDSDSKMASLVKCLLGPRLIRVYSHNNRQGWNYVPNGAEILGDKIISLISWSFHIGLYTSPCFIWLLYKKNCFSSENFHSLVSFGALIIALGVGSLAARTYGRCQQPSYLEFINALEKIQSKYNAESRKLLSQYDFDFRTWPVHFRWSDAGKDANKPRFFLEDSHGKRSLVEVARALPCQLLGYVIAHTIGIRLLYPGTFLRHFIEPQLIDGRAQLIEETDGQRYKLIAKDGNAIDTIVVDRRERSEFSNGDILVICCEGNAGFYEVGIPVTALKAGYSILGWNHPGFGGSTGLPFPRAEQNAIDVVVQFAIHDLKFPPERIVLYGWSIGGFSASWAAMNYPNLRGVVLDATFDHVFPLAANVMPPSWKPLVSATVRHHLNLSVADQLARYPGPVLLVRRTADEIITLQPNDLASNRGNDLVMKLLKFRYPNIVDDVTIPVLRQWLSANIEGQESLLRYYQVDQHQCTEELKKFVKDHGNSFPLEVGQNFTDNNKIKMSLFLVKKYMIDFDSTHCTPLPAELFNLPEEVGLDAQFVDVSTENYVHQSNL